MNRRTCGHSRNRTCLDAKELSRKLSQMNLNGLNRDVRKTENLTYKITVPKGLLKFDQKWLINQLYQKVENFKPIFIAPNNIGDLEFYIRDKDTALTIVTLSRRIRNPETSALVKFDIQKVPAPWVKLNKQDVAIINLVVDKRYNEELRLLDLSDFGSDKDFFERDLLMPLTKGNVMLTVVDRIHEKYRNITALNLSNNGLKFLDFAACISSVARQINDFDLSFNLVSSESELEKFYELPVTCFKFQGNPVNEKFQNEELYISFIEKVFPRCSILDDVVIKPINDENHYDRVELPYLGGYCKKDSIRNLVENFLKSYFEQYDGPDGAKTRKNLLNIYDFEKSSFTLSIRNLRTETFTRYPSDERYAIYARKSHNVLYKEKFANDRKSRVINGSMEIMVAISELPITRHYQNSFTTDVFLETDEIIGFSVQGIFEDGYLSKDGEDPVFNFFQRTFMISQGERGFLVIISDSLFISALGPARLERFNNLLAEAKKNVLDDQLERETCSSELESHVCEETMWNSSAQVDVIQDSDDVESLVEMFPKHSIND